MRYLGNNKLKENNERDVMVQSGESKPMVDKTEAEEKKMKFVTSSSMRVWTRRIFTLVDLWKWWHLSKRGAKIGVDKRCLRCGGAVWVDWENLSQGGDY